MSWKIARDKREKPVEIWFIVCLGFPAVLWFFFAKCFSSHTFTFFITTTKTWKKLNEINLAKLFRSLLNLINTATFKMKISVKRWRTLRHIPTEQLDCHSKAKRRLEWKCNTIFFLKRERKSFLQKAQTET